jgi:hypothetical protein
MAGVRQFGAAVVFILGLLSGGCASEPPPGRVVELSDWYTAEIRAVSGVDVPATVRKRVIGRIDRERLLALLRADEVLPAYQYPNANSR